ncbi:MAG: hypothetical protein ACYTFA_06705 [Planctomycetota bacterium]|jgi:hypothetical protein
MMYRERANRLVLVFVVPMVLPQIRGMARAGEDTPQDRGDAGPVLSPYTLQIEPDDEYLRTGGRHAVYLHGEQVWSRRLPYTLQKYAITARGWVVGVAYSTSTRRPPGGGKRKLFLHVVILDATGREILNDVTERLSGPTIKPGVDQKVPYVRQILVDSEHDRVTIRGQDDNTPGDSRLDFWWVYRLSTGERIKRFRPTTGRSKMFDPVRGMLNTAVVWGTPFVLVHWYLPGGGARFTLVGFDDKEIWGLDLDDDYAHFDESTKQDLRNYLTQNPGILKTNKPRYFTIRSFAANATITFAVTRAGDDDWSVTEVSRAEYAAPVETGVPAKRQGADITGE